MNGAGCCVAKAVRQLLMSGESPMASVKRIYQSACHEQDDPGQYLQPLSHASVYWGKYT